MVGCVSKAPAVSKPSLVLRTFGPSPDYIRVPQIPLDNPEHLADFMDTLRPWCPMNIPYFEAQRNAEQALATQVIVQRFPELLIKLPPDRDVLRSARYACWALAVYHYGPDPYYWPLEALHSDFDISNVNMEIELVPDPDNEIELKLIPSDPDNMEDDMTPLP